MYEGTLVLDMCDERGILAGQMLADMGADVIAVEPPSGNSARRRPPFAGGRPGLETSAYWLGYARGKRGITLDHRTPDGRALFDDLLAKADVLLLNGKQRLDGLGGYEAFAEVNPRLVVAAITAFGLDGPKADYAATDITLMAASGATMITGDPDRAPLRGTLPQAWLHAASDAAVGVLVALAEREQSGKGQLVSVSAQVSAMNATQATIVATGVGDSPTQRAAGGVRFMGIDLKFTYPCADGFVSITLLFGTVGGPFTARLMQWVHEEGFCDEATATKEWIGYGLALVTGKEPVSEYDRVKECVTKFTLSKPKAELFREAMVRHVLLAPCATSDDLLDSAQLKARDYFWHVPSPITGEPVAVPGAFAKFSRSPMQLGRSAPRLGEHNTEVYSGLLGLSAEDLAALAGNTIT